MSKKEKTDFKVKLIDDKLILSFVSKSEPKILHIDLGKSHVSHLSIKEIKDKFVIFLEQEKGKEDLDIYSFSTKKQALSVFKEIVNVMLTSKDTGFFKSTIKIALVLLVIYLLASMFPFSTSLNNSDALISSSSIEEGVSVPLEAILK